MIYKLYLTRDSTIYKCDETKNAGMDPQLVLQSYYDMTPYTNTITKSATRILLDFEYLTNQKYAQYSSSIQSMSALLYISNLQLETGEPYNINCHILTSQWHPGIGLDAYKYYYNGVTWNYNSKSSDWTVPGGDFNSQNYTTNSFTYKNNEYITIPIQQREAPYGYLLKFDNTYQTLTSSNVGHVGFYSTKTHTIYCPSMLLYINDYIYNTGSSSFIDETKQIQLYINNFKNTYMVDQKIQFNITCKNIIFDRTWSNSYWSQPKYILPQTTTCSYRIWDVTDLRKQVFIDFDHTYTRISCNSSIGNYFTLDMSQFYENRMYQIQLMTHTPTGTKTIYNNKYTFKIK